MRSLHRIGPVDGRPVMLDDTSYFLPCERPEEAQEAREARTLPFDLVQPGRRSLLVL